MPASPARLARSAGIAAVRRAVAHGKWRQGRRQFGGRPRLAACLARLGAGLPRLRGSGGGALGDPLQQDRRSRVYVSDLRGAQPFGHIFVVMVCREHFCEGVCVSAEIKHVALRLTPRRAEWIEY